MKNEKYGSQIFILLLTAFPFWLPLLLWIGYVLMGWISTNDTAEVYEKRWGIEISSEWREVYHAESSPSFHGDGTWYDIYENVSEGSVMKMGISFIKGINGVMAEEFEFAAEELEIEYKNRPDFKGEFVWARLSKEDGSYLIFVFYPKENRLFLAQSMF